VKYSILPQHLHRAELLGANGLVQGSTFVAIIFGTILGTELILTDSGVAAVSVLVVAIAAAGFAASLFVPPAPPLGARQGVDWLFPRAIWQLVRLALGHTRARRAILSIGWFWFLGATFLALLPAYTREVLGADEGVLTVLLTGFSLGVAIGALGSEWLGRGEVSFALPPVGALGLALMAAELWLATPAEPLAVAPALADRSDFFASATGWRLLADFVLIAGFAGIYVTPLNAVLQAAAPPERRARFIAASNMIDAVFMVGSSAVAAALLWLGLGPTQILALLALGSLPVGLTIARYAPGSALGRIAAALWPCRDP
jgi:hypothetical protein